MKGPLGMFRNHVKFLQIINYIYIISITNCKNSKRLKKINLKTIIQKVSFQIQYKMSGHVHSSDCRHDDEPPSMIYNS